MPQYEYFCNNEHPHKGCGHGFSEILNIDERMEPMNNKCPKCKKEGYICREAGREIPNLLGIRSSIGMNPGSKMDRGVRDQIDRLKHENPSMITKILD